MQFAQGSFITDVYDVPPDQQMETKASINLCPMSYTPTLIHTRACIQYSLKVIQCRDRFTEDSFLMIWFKWSLRYYSACTAHLALEDELPRLHASSRIIENVQVNWPDTMANRSPWPCARCNYPSPAVGSSETPGPPPCHTHQTNWTAGTVSEGEINDYRHGEKHTKQNRISSWCFYL